ncbi:Multiple epidermal growth factor-like domains protein 10, partial [Temnothorax longispinosus]
ETFLCYRGKFLSITIFSLENMTCNHVTGEYVCRTGYLGLTCEHPCPLNRYGLNCANHCHCKNGGECHHVYANVDLAGKASTVKHPARRALTATTVNADLRMANGHCQCPPGWTGTMCTEICPEGYYGHHCLETCECKNEFFRCHSVEGCICRQGYTGENCDVQLFSRNIQEKDIKDILAGVFAIIVIIGALLAGWMCRRRRMADVKNEIAQVQYTA